MEAMDLLLEAAGIGSIKVFSNTMDPPGIWSVWMAKCATLTPPLTTQCRISPDG
ncbi:MAG: hypothetical protein ACLSA6_06085 [Holdemania massiliensis]